MRRIDSTTIQVTDSDIFDVLTRPWTIVEIRP